MISSKLLVVAHLFLAQPAGIDHFFEFRQGKPMSPKLKLAGPDVADVAVLDEHGLRVTLPGARKKHHGIVLKSNFPVKGDFDLIATFDILSSSTPLRGYGVGVSLNLATDDARTKFIKVSCSRHVGGFEGFMTEHWDTTDMTKKVYQQRRHPSGIVAGRLRITRDGDFVQCSYSEGQGLDFTPIYKAKFGTEDLVDVKFTVADSGEPGNPIDARLIDWRIRSEIRNEGGPVNVARVPDGNEPPPPPDGNIEPTDRGPSTALLAAIGVVALIVIGIVFALLTRRKKETPKTETEPTGDFVRVACPSCAKPLRMSSLSVAKKVKCPGCGSLFSPNDMKRDA